MDIYSYAPLNSNEKEIRLMTLLAGSFSDRVEIRLRHVHFAVDEMSILPKFEALSYRWGELSDVVDITVNTHSPEATLAHSYRLQISKSLAAALPYLRREGSDRSLWVDAICIDQGNLEERSSQVRRMAHIYSQAERVLAWLGPEEGNSRHAMEILESLAIRIIVDWPTQTMQPTSDEYSEWADMSTSLPFSEVDWDAIQSLCSRSWFERLWIRQEIWLAKKGDVICGSSIMPWESFRRAVFCMYNKPRTIEIPGFWDRLELLETLINNDGPHSLGYNVYRSRHSKCLDPRDRIYAMLGLLTEDTSEWSVIPDYSKSICEVYKSVALGYMEAFLDLDFLRFCHIDSREHEPDLPSWVPDWRSLAAAAPSLPNYSAQANASASIQFEGDSLHALGLSIGLVKMTTEIQMDPNTPYDDAVLDIQRFAKPHMPDATDPRYETRLNALCRTLIVDDFRERADPPSSPLTEQRARTAFLKMWNVTRADFNTLFANDQDVQLYLNKAQWCCTQRALISTSNGLIGLAPKSTLAGDIVCILLGCSNPLIIRRTVEHPESERVVGECYIDSIMGGEAFLGPLPEKITQLSKLDEDLGYNRQAFLDHTSKIDFTDPRYALFLGDRFEEHLDLEGYDEEDENRVKLIQVMKVRGIELDQFKIV